MSADPGFIHLRVHSAYSLAEGAIKTKELVKLCKKHGYPAVGVTDTGNLFGALEFAMAASDDGIQPIIGCQMWITPFGPQKKVAGRVLGPGADQLVLLVQSEQGYRNLMRLVSVAFMETETGLLPQVSLEKMEGLTDGLICLTGGVGGGLNRLLLDGQKPHALDLMERLKTLFPGRLYIELMRHVEGPLAQAEDKVEADLIDLAYAHDIPLVATNDAYYADASMYEAHDVLLCIADGAYVMQEDRRRVSPHHYFKSPQEMRDLFADIPEAVDNTVVIAKRCAYMPRKVNPILPPFASANGREEPDELRAQAHDGLTYRLNKYVFTSGMAADEKDKIEKEYRARLDFELETIIKMKFPGYFLIVSDFIKWAKDNGIPVGPGRGSGAGSLVAWSLLITDLDPIRYGLLFERFLNPERVSMPDFDIDFCQDRREEVIKYVQQKYGYDKVGQIITFGKLQARAVVRDVGRTLQMPYGQVDRICKLIPNNPANPVTLQQALDGEPQLQEMKRGDETVDRLLTIALRLEGLYRHASTHAAGVVIGDRPLDQLVPMYRDPRSDMPVTQFNMKYVELAGLVKFDFLGLKTLTVLKTAVDHVRDLGPELDLLDLDMEDAKSYSILGRAESAGIFQLESSGMRDVLRRMKPNRIEDIIALVSLYRPGPMDNIPKYIKVKFKQEEPDYMHPALQPILEETFGIMVYQEQVMQIAQVLAGYSLGGADLLRRAMGKKIKEEMEKERAKFIAGSAEKLAVPEEQSGLIFDQVNKFAGYGFNKSHAAAYALVAYQTAFMKANYPVEFMAATMTYDMGNTDKLNQFRQELVRLGIRLLPPDVNASEPRFRVEKLADGSRAVRYALAAVKGVGQQAMEMVVRERATNGPFKDIFDFARRVDSSALNKRMLEKLVCAGAFDSLNRNRQQLFAGLETVVRYAQAEAQQRESGMASLFGGSEAMKAPDLPKVPDWDPLERLRHEFEAIGFYLSAHPLDSFGPAMNRMKVVKFSELPRLMRDAKSTRFKLAGIVVAKQERTAKSGNRFAFVTLSDASGVYEVTLFAETLAQSREMLEAGRAVLLSVDAQKNGEEMRLTCHGVLSLEDEVAKSAAGLRILLDDVNAVSAIKTTIGRLPPGRGKVTLAVELDALREVEIAIPGAVSINAASRGAFKSIPGVIEVQEL
ncbi:DNA polymerase III subunit alpha [Niveispirillum cyanobacteriorum]|uniref:DNA polymerase III subunit alpha n=1 Tax=Niveispirillum cyanobacteriorum TaxID=1612173 RepID=A0A2K9N9M5_9PROT|nr:DNA polymerase III subunit alpha [Niveispirillum cyanobacteriorum]AUN29850.1 DNA polymerase III subunit alpha [Niveispirillum cyanobacteriorum]GGE60207.1 DNA-directed DNA polymerase [Niveispirillum cyanobacteriorum]